MFCKNIGVTNVFNYREVDFFKEIKDLNIGGMDVILDFIGGDYTQKNINLLNTEGKLINIGFQKGSKGELNLMKVMLKRLIITGSTLRIRDDNFKNMILKDLVKNIFPNLENGEIKIHIDSIYNLEEAYKAHERLDKSDIGKVVLKP